ncbi:MAG: N-acetylmuramoyl-L-alanine amidase [Jatrophihabitans sp.]|nr:N-acetylmuramoyl-L-alanine amidase [Jatrophihabitans sp.]
MTGGLTVLSTQPAAALAPPKPGTYQAVSPTQLLAPTVVAAKATISAELDGAVSGLSLSAAVVRVTATSPGAAGFATVFDRYLYVPRPAVSDLTFAAGQTVSGLVVVPVGKHHDVSIYNGSAGATTYSITLEGYYVSGAAKQPGAFHTTTPTRLLDTSKGTGAAEAPVGGHGVVTFAVAGAAGIPATGVGAVLLNVSALTPSVAGFATVYAGDTSRQPISNLTFPAGTTTRVPVIVPVTSAGTVAIYNGAAGPVDFAADVEGWFGSGTVTAAGAYQPVAVTRVLSDPGAWNSTLTVKVPLAGQAGIPGTGVTAVVLNLTVVGHDAAGTARLFPSTSTPPAAATASYGRNQTTRTLVIAPLGPDGAIALTHTAGTVDYDIDVEGYFTAADAPPPPVTNFSVTVGAYGNSLHWTNPVGLSFTGVVIRRKAGSVPPSSSHDGVLVIDTALHGLKASTSTTDLPPTPGAQYAYAAFAHDAVPRYAAPATAVTPAVLAGATPRCGAITADQTWSAGAVQQLTCPVRVDYGVTLTIAPGAVVKANRAAGLDVEGVLNAVGTAAQPISFTSVTDDSVHGDDNGDGTATRPVPGNWLGIRGPGAPPDGEPNPTPQSMTLTHVAVRYAGITVTNVYNLGADDPSPDPVTTTITDSTVSRGGTISVDAIGTTTVTGNVVTNLASDFSAMSSSQNGYRQAGIYVGSDYGAPHLATVSDNVVNGSPDYGIWVSTNAATITGNKAENTRLEPLRVSDQIDPSRISGNTAGPATRAGLALDGDLVSDLTLPFGSLPIAVPCEAPPIDSDGPECGGLSIDAGVTMTVAAGVIVKFYPPDGGDEYGAALYVNGNLVVNGTPTAPAVFTSVLDDAEGGDYNQDGSATTPSGREWYGITGSGSLTVHNLVIRFDRSAEAADR